MDSKYNILTKGFWTGKTRRQKTRVGKNNPGNEESNRPPEVSPSPDSDALDQPRSQEYTQTSVKPPDQQPTDPARRNDNSNKSLSKSVADLPGHTLKCSTPLSPPIKVPESRRQSLTEEDNDSTGSEEEEKHDDDDDQNEEQEGYNHDHMESDFKPKASMDRSYDAKSEFEKSFEKGGIRQPIKDGRFFNESHRYAGDKRLLAPGIEIGTYLLRRSRDGYALSVRCKNSLYGMEIRTYKIRVNDKGECYIDGATNRRTFNSIGQLIAYYTEKPGLQCKLKQPLLQEGVAGKISESKQEMKKPGSGNFSSVYNVVNTTYGIFDDAELKSASGIPVTASPKPVPTETGNISPRPNFRRLTPTLNQPTHGGPKSAFDVPEVVAPQFRKQQEKERQFQQRSDSGFLETSFSSTQSVSQLADQDIFQYSIDQTRGQVGMNQLGTQVGVQPTGGHFGSIQLGRQASEQRYVSHKEVVGNENHGEQHADTNRFQGPVYVNEAGGQTTHALGTGRGFSQTAYQVGTRTGKQQANLHLGGTYHTDTVKKNTQVQSTMMTNTAYLQRQGVRCEDDEIDLESKVLSSPRRSERVNMMLTERCGQQKHQEVYAYGSLWMQREEMNDGRSAPASLNSIRSINPEGSHTLRPDVTRSGGHQSNAYGSFVNSPVSQGFGPGRGLSASVACLTDDVEWSHQTQRFVRNTSKYRQKPNNSRDDALIYQHSTNPYNPYILPHKRELLAEESSRPKMRAETSYVARQEFEISFRKGDILQFIRDGEDNESFVVRNLTTGEEGYIHKDFETAMTRVDVESHKCLTKEFNSKESEERLLAPEIEIGTYLLQPSRDGYALSLRCESELYELAIRHYMIRVNDKGECYIDGVTSRRTFNSIEQLIEYYTKEPGLRCNLKQPLDDLAVKFSDLKLEEKLDFGNFGTVYAGTLHRNKQVTVKVLRAGVLISIEEFRMEAETMYKLRHQNLVSLLAICENDNKIYIITERVSNVTLLTLLREDKKINFKDLIDIAIQVAEGMCYLERNRFVHRDLRAANVFVGDGNITKIADCGLTRLLNSYYGQGDLYGNGFVIPYKWTAPEAIKQQKFTVKSDVWSFGILLYEIVTHGDEPYAAMNSADAFDWVEKGNRLKRPTNHHCPLALYNAMLQCWQLSPDKRPDFECTKEALMEIKKYG